MKKFILSIMAMMTIAFNANAMSFTQAQREALFLTDKMAYELNLTDEQYDACYEINLDYLMSVSTVDDLYGSYWTRRNIDMGYVLFDWQLAAFRAATYFYRPLYWDAGCWHFGIYARYPRRTFYYFSHPTVYVSYRGGHSWRMNGGHSYYHGHQDRFRNHRVEHVGMRDHFKNGRFNNTRPNVDRNNTRPIIDRHNNRPNIDRNTNRPSVDRNTNRPNIDRNTNRSFESRTNILRKNGYSDDMGIRNNTSDRGIRNNTNDRGIRNNTNDRGIRNSSTRVTVNREGSSPTHSFNRGSSPTRSFSQGRSVRSSSGGIRSSRAAQRK